MSSDTKKPPFVKGNEPCSAGERCRLCRCSFKIEKGNTVQHISTENLFKLPGRKGVEKWPLDKLISEDLGLSVVNTDECSPRVCAKCALKIRNAAELFRFVKENLNPPPVAIEEADDSHETQQRWKRRSTSPSSAEKPKSAKITPFEQESQATTAQRGSRVKKSFTFSASNGQVCRGDIPNENSDFQKEAERLCNILQSQSATEKPGQPEVKVIFRCGNGEFKLRTPSDKITRSLIKNIVLRNWKSAANIVMSHKDMEPFLRTALSSKVSSEFKHYCEGTNSILKGTSPEELSAYSNRYVSQEVKVMCPFWHASVVGACGVHQHQDKELKASNAIALSTSATARSRNQRMSALASRISVILLHSGAKSQDFTRLNGLGVSLSQEKKKRFQSW